MKKLLLSILLSVLVFGSAFAQIRWQTNTTIGQELKAANTANKDTLILDFKNTVVYSAVSSWWPARATANLGKDSVVKKTLQTQRGIQVKGFVNNSTTTAYEDGTFRCNNAGGNGNPGRFTGVDSLKQYLIHSIKTGTLNGSANDSLTRPAACLFNVGANEIAFGMWPGKVTKIEYIYRFDYTGKACTDDITFEMDTYDAGTTGKTATYELAVYKSSVSDANLIGTKVSNIYTTGQGLKTVNVAASIGVASADLSNKQLYIVIKTLGTNNDGVAHPVDASNIPLYYDPTVVFDNFVAIYASSSWDAPSGITVGAVLNHNNGSPVVTTSTDFSGGTAVPVYPATDYPINIYLTSKDRIGILEIKEGNDGGGHIAAYSFAATGAVKKKAADGTFSIDVPYTYIPSDGTTIMYLTIPAPASGSVNDTLEIQLLANVPDLATRAVRLEITNGIRFWYNVAAVGDVSTSVDKANNNGITAYGANNLLYVKNATEYITLYNIAGQKVKSVSSTVAAKGINVNAGIYIVKTGSTVQKVIVD